MTRKLNKSQLRDQDESMKEYRENVSNIIDTMNEPRVKRERKLTEKAKALLEEAQIKKDNKPVTFN